MKVFLYLVFISVYPLHKGEQAPVPCVAFDTLSAKKLLYYLDSLDYLTIKYKEIEKLNKLLEETIKKYDEKIVLMEKAKRILEIENSIYKDELRKRRMRIWLERVLWGSSIILIIILMR